MKHGSRSSGRRRRHDQPFSRMQLGGRSVAARSRGADSEECTRMIVSSGKRGRWTKPIGAGIIVLGSRFLKKLGTKFVISSPLSFPPDTGQQVVHRSLSVNQFLDERETIRGRSRDHFIPGRSIFKAGIGGCHGVSMTGRRSERVDQLRFPAGHDPGHFPGVIMHDHVEDVEQDKSGPAMDLEEVRRAACGTRGASSGVAELWSSAG